MGLLDQAAALDWIAENIGGFGGDAEQVTVAGQSAGAHAIPKLAELANGRPRFRRAVLQSGSFFRPASTAADMAPTAAVFLRALGVEPGSADALSRLQAAPAESILHAQALALAEGERLGGAQEAFRPISPVPATGAERIPAVVKAMTGIEVMLGITSNETHAFIGRPELPDHDEVFAAARLRAITGREDALEFHRARYPGSTLRNILCEAMTAESYFGPTEALADALSTAGVKLFGYVFDWAPPGSRYRACHCIDLPFLFGNFGMWPGAGMLEGGDAGEMEALSAMARRALITFVHDGVPQPHRLIEWPRYESAGKQVMRLGSRVGAGTSYFV
jgi:para-nitrobenzyl esterase